jgi:hypothetical protein
MYKIHKGVILMSTNEPIITIIDIPIEEPIKQPSQPTTIPIEEPSRVGKNMNNV